MSVKTNRKFKKSWENIKPIDTSNDVVVTGIKGRVIKIMPIRGRNTIVAEYKNKLDFLDTETLEPLRKNANLCSRNLKPIGLEIFEMDGELYAFFDAYSLDNKFRHTITLLNIDTGKRNILQETDNWVEHTMVEEIEGELFAFIAYDPGVIQKWNLKDLKLKSRIKVSDESSLIHLFFADNKDNSVLVVWQKKSIGIDKSVNYTMWNAETCEQIGETISLPEDRDKGIISIGENYAFVSITGDNKLYVIDTSSAKIIKEVLIDENPEYKMAVSNPLSISNYSEKALLTIGAWSNTKLFDMSNLDSPKSYKTENGETLDVKTAPISSIYEGKPVVIEKNTGVIWSQETMMPLEGTNGPAIVLKNNNIIKDVFPVKLTDGTDIFLANVDMSHGEGNKQWIVWNPRGLVRNINSYSIHKAITETKLNDKDVFITVATDNHIYIYDSESGDLVNKSAKIEDVSNTNLLLKVGEIKGEPVLFVAYKKYIKAYSLPKLKEIRFKIDIDYSYNSIDVINIDGKNLIVGSNSKIYTWDLETGNAVHSPLSIYNEDGEILSDEFTISTVNLSGKDNLVISSSESITYIWNPEKKLVDYLNFDDEMWSFREDDSYYGIYKSIKTDVNGKELIITASHHGAVVVFDPLTGNRVGNIIHALEDFNDDYISIMDLRGHKIIVTKDDNCVKVWDVETSKKLKDVKFEEEDKVTSVTTSGNKIIICHLENITAIEVL